ncbi:MAG: hypothetical protein HBSAPP03_10060 [Phycisphaerae bacterium]|nr:MAG: hypothetical protein HBSAPP03_10060 [Phycisphaerae bacterium]
MFESMSRVAVVSVAFLGATAPLARAQFLSQGIQLRAHVDLPAFSAASGNSCWGWVSPGGREYAVMGLDNKVSFVDITNPDAPVIRSNIPHAAGLWADVKVYSAGGQTYCYVSSETAAVGGIQVINMTNLDTTGATLVGLIAGSPTRTHTIALNETSGHLYLCGSNTNGGSLIAYSLANPAAPVHAGQWAGPYIHEAQIVTYTTGPYAGKEIAFCCCEDNGLYIVDVTNKSNMVVLGSTTYPGISYCHQGWLSPDRTLFYLNDELDGPAQGVTPTLTRIINVVDLANPTLAGTFTSGAPSAVDHNLYTLGRYIFESNYKSGLRVFDTQGAGTPLAPVEVAWIDTYPGDDGAQYNGTWSNYPYFPSGTIIISDIDRGLFVVTLNLDYLTFAHPAPLPTRLQPNARTPITVDITTTGSAIDPASVTLYAKIDAGAFVPVVMTPLGNNRYTANLPAASCLSVVSYYIAARNTTGAQFTSPNGAPTYSNSAQAYAGLATLFSYDMETTAGWSRDTANDTATSGLWERGDPQGTIAQPEDDHTPPPGVNCWVTGRTAGAGAGSNDVDGGFTAVLSPVMNMSSAPVDTRIGYWRWYSNNAGGAPNADVFTVQLSNNGGTSWSNVEVVGPSGPGTGGGWNYYEFQPTTILPLTAQMRMKFIADDAGAGSLIEAALDDMSVFSYDCVNVCPAIAQHPAAQDAVEGGTVQLSIAASAPGGVAYQWRRNNVPLVNGPGVAGATGSTLTLTGVDAADAGAYDCLVSAACGSLLSNLAAVTVAPACDPDVNCDGSANGVDVEVQELAVGGDFTDYCQVGLPNVDDGDFNRDGAVNGTDVEAVENAVGGVCP